MAEYTTFRGKPCCVCLAEWLPVFEKELIRRGHIKHNIDIAKLRDRNPNNASAGTHAGGGAFDIFNYSTGVIRTARDLGADATWHRRPSQGPWVHHAHGVLRGCPHNGPARYQIAEVDNGQNGLVGNAKDDGPRPLSKRTWREGIAFAKAQSTPVPAPKPNVTVFDTLFWNVAKPEWYAKYPWSQRKEKIAAVMRSLSCSIICCAETYHSYQTADILRGIGSQYQHASSPHALDIFFDSTKWKMTRALTEYSLKAQSRYAAVLHLERRETGVKVAVVNTHLPYGSPSLRATAATNLVKLLADVDDVIVLTGDFNNEAFTAGQPHSKLRAAGYKFMREQTSVANASAPEYPSKNQWLSDIATRRPGLAHITAGEHRITPVNLSDHHPLKARVTVTP